MNNLKLYSEVSLNLELHSDGESVLFSAFDIELKRLFFVSSANLVYTTMFGKEWRDIVICAGVHSIDLDDEDFITSFDYLMEKEALLIGTSNGLLLLHAVDDNTSEIVGQVEGGIKCFSSSPDSDLIAIATNLGKILMMDHDWDVLYEIALAPHGEPRFSFKNNFESSISWRGDGKYLATLSSFSSSEKKIYVWERDSGALHAASDLHTFMGTVLDWMPRGAKIAAVRDRRVENLCPAIAFYERNGLPRSFFSIDDEISAELLLLKWNHSSELLASLARCACYDSVKIWLLSNSHWFLKQEIRFLRHEGIQFTWNPLSPLQLVCWTLRGRLTAYSFIWVSAMMDNSIALVIDGTKLLVTPLALSFIPPPMYYFSLSFTSPVREVALCSHGCSKSSVAAFLSDGQLCMVELPGLDDEWEELEGKQASVGASFCETEFGSLAHLTWLDPKLLLAVSHSQTQTHLCNCGLVVEEIQPRVDHLEEFEFSPVDHHVQAASMVSSGWHAKSLRRTCLEGRAVVGIVANPVEKFSALVQLGGGRIHEHACGFGLAISRGGSVVPRHEFISLPSSCPWMTAVGLAGCSRPLMIVALNEAGRLYMNGSLLLSNCTGFASYSKMADRVASHLVLLSRQDFLWVLDAGNIVCDSGREVEMASADQLNVWEKGARILGVLHGDHAAVVMQTARGSLECMYPRRLVLASILDALSRSHFRDSLTMVRRHRIDLNVIADYFGWQLFIQHVSEFVRQVDNFSLLTEFICAMKNVDMAQTLYGNYASLPCNDNPATGRDDAREKVSSIMLAVKKSLEELLPDTPGRELCILTTLARRHPPALGEALKRIKCIREMELFGDNDAAERKSSPSSSEALKHLLWLCDSQAVFEAALGLYDLSLAAMVAMHSDRDPKEFLPYLQGLEQMPPLIMRHAIDLKLNRFESALKHAVLAGNAYDSPCLDLLNRNPFLFPLSLQLITDPTKRRRVLEAWGDHLANSRQFEDAAATYICCSCFKKAMKSHRASGNWRGVLTLAGLLQLEKGEVVKLAREIGEELQAIGRAAEAARIALDYCADVGAGVGLLVAAMDWDEAVRVALMHHREDLVAGVKSSSLECANSLILEFTAGLEKVGQYSIRYLAVRHRRLLLAAKLQSESQLVSSSVEDDDSVSDASSNFCGMSAYSTGTGGTRSVSATSMSSHRMSKASSKKLRRNSGKIRPGSPEEETGLAEHLKSMAPTAESKCHLKSLLLSLLMLGEEEVARKLQAIAEKLHLSQMAAIKLVEETITSNVISDQFTLDYYLQNIRNQPTTLDSLSWRIQAIAENQ